MLPIIIKLFKQKEKIPVEFMRMVQTEFRYVPYEYVESFVEKHKRLPTMEELSKLV